MVTGLVEAHLKHQYDDRCSEIDGSRSKVTVVHQSSQTSHQLSNVSASVNEVDPEQILLKFLEEWDATTKEADLDLNKVEADLSDHLGLALIFRSGIHRPDVSVVN